MLFLVALVIATGLAATLRRREPFTVHARTGLAAAMVFAAVAHLLMPEPFVQHLPEWVPERYALIYASGLAEIVLGLALIWPARWRPWAGLALAAYLIAVFPANVYVAVQGIDVTGQPGGIYPWLRLPFQALFVWLALWTTGATAVARAHIPAIGSSRQTTAAITKANVNA